jgi:hypothetical protein
MRGRAVGYMPVPVEDFTVARVAACMGGRVEGCTADLAEECMAAPEVVCMEARVGALTRVRAVVCTSGRPLTMATRVHGARVSLAFSVPNGARNTARDLTRSHPARSNLRRLRKVTNPAPDLNLRRPLLLEPEAKIALTTRGSCPGGMSSRQLCPPLQ